MPYKCRLAMTLHRMSLPPCLRGILCILLAFFTRAARYARRARAKLCYGVYCVSAGAKGSNSRHFFEGAALSDGGPSYRKVTPNRKAT